VYNFCIGRKLREITGCPVVEPDADAEENITLGNRHIGCIGSVHAEHPEVAGMIEGHDPDSHEGRNHGNTGEICNLVKDFLAFRNMQSPADKKERFLCFLKLFRRFL